MAGLDEWVVLELSSRSEGEDPDTVRASIAKSVPLSEVFVPAVATLIGGDRVIHSLVEGYAFVQRGAYSDSVFMRLESTRFVQSVLSESGGSTCSRRLSVVHTADIDRMRQQMQRQVHQGIGIGDKVRITTGPYRNIEATVIEEIPEDKVVQVYVALRSKQTIVTIPRSGLLVLERAPLSPSLSRLTGLRAWLRQTRPVILWQGERHIGALQGTYARYERISRWMTAGHQAFSVASFVDGHLQRRLRDFRTRLGTLSKFDSWCDRLSRLFSFVHACLYATPERALGEIQAKLVTLAWLEDVDERIKSLSQEVECLAHAARRLVDGDELVVQNVLVDGANLARRCFATPGLDELKDSSGRPTGAITGFLRSLGALKKRYPGTRFYVAWDGSNRRRKKLYPEYKADRVDPGAAYYDQVGFIRKVLPALGVRQLCSEEEEADDIIAAVVHGELSAQYNLIFSNDRDLLQLVSQTTVQLVPGSGIRKEILFDAALVEEHFGVPPEKLVQLRSFYGDASDHIPGVPRVPKKVLRSLVQAYGGVDQVYKSGLTGLSKGQYERLRGSEPQVRINLALMSLVDVPVSVTDPDVDADLVSSSLKGMEINPNPILEAFFEQKAEAANG